VQVIFMPPWHFSNFMVQRGTIIMFMPAGMPEGIPVVPAPPIIPVIMAARSIIIVPDIGDPFARSLRAVAPGISF
jgi:hypothetical protein